MRVIVLGGAGGDGSLRVDALAPLCSRPFESGERMLLITSSS